MSLLRGVLINPRRACAAKVTVVGSVCVSVTQHLTSRTFVCLAIGTTYSTGSEGQKVSVVFSENAPRVHNDRCACAVLYVV